MFTKICSIFYALQIAFDFEQNPHSSNGNKHHGLNLKNGKSFDEMTPPFLHSTRDEASSPIRHGRPIISNNNRIFGDGELEMEEINLTDEESDQNENEYDDDRGENEREIIYEDDEENDRKFPQHITPFSPGVAGLLSPGIPNKFAISISPPAPPPRIGHAMARTN